MGTKYQQLLMKALNKSISSLVSGSQPGTDPAKSAWAWFSGTGGAEPSQVNLYMQGVIGSGSVSLQSSSPSKNWATWSSALNSTFGTATGSVANWLGREYSQAAADLPTVPEDVITWTEQNLPTGIGVVVVRGRQPSRTGQD